MEYAHPMYSVKTTGMLCFLLWDWFNRWDLEEDEELCGCLNFSMEWQLKLEEGGTGLRGKQQQPIIGPATRQMTGP